VVDNRSGDFESMFHHISKGAWTFADRDHGLQISDGTAECLKVIFNYFGYKHFYLLKTS